MTDLVKEVTDQNADCISEIIDTYMLQIDDIGICYQIAVKAVLEHKITQMEKFSDQIHSNLDLARSANRKDQVDAIRTVMPAQVAFNKLKQAKSDDTIKGSLFIALFNAFDVYTGDILRCLFKIKPNLFGLISDKQIDFSVVLSASNLEEIKEQVLEEFIDSFRRKSYIEQFSQLETIFGLKKLTGFDGWKEFVEASQRRNILTHCGGVVTSQYLEICNKHTVKLDDGVELNSQLNITHKYFIKCINIMMDLGLLLGQTLWRKVAPEQIHDAARHLNHVIYEELRTGRLALAERHSIFAQTQMMQTGISDLDKTISIFNLALSYYLKDNKEKVKEIIAGVDISASLPEFKLANFVLLEDFENAATVMKKIGKSGDLIFEECYGLWPLFKKFRETTQFMEAYESIYGYSFSENVIKSSDHQAEINTAKAAEIDSDDEK